MDKDLIPLKKAFVKHKWNWRHSKDLEDNISVKNKEDMYLYNYRDEKLVDRNHPVLMKCRGIVIRDDGKVLNFPFERFFNDWQEEKAEINWNTAEIQEKVDGSLVCVFWNKDKWEITTRGTFYPLEKAETDFSELFKKHFDNFHRLQRDVCYMFELVTNYNRIVTWYDEERVYLVGARKLYDLKEISQKELDKIASYLSVYRPRRFKADNFEECRKLFDNFKDDEEGLVIVDNDFNRVKVKQESYFKLARIKMLKEQDLFEYVLGINPIDEEYLKKCPEVIEGINAIKKEWENIIKKIDAVFEKIKSKPNRKEFAFEAIKYPFKSVLFSKLDNKEIKNLKWEYVKEWR